MRCLIFTYDVILALEPSPKSYLVYQVLKSNYQVEFMQKNKFRFFCLLKQVLGFWKFHFILIGELCVWRNIFWGNIFRAKRLLGKTPRTEHDEQWFCNSRADLIFKTITAKRGMHALKLFWEDMHKQIISTIFIMCHLLTTRINGTLIITSLMITSI